jgi:signal peptidase I
MYTEIKEQKKERNFKEDIIDFIQSVAIALAFTAFLFIFVITPNEVVGESMLPNYQSGDRLYTNKLVKWFSNTDIGQSIGLNYNRGDVVVVDKPGLGSSLIKRIIGLPGEKIKIENGDVYINGKKLVENYLKDGMHTPSAMFLNEGVEKEIPADNYFVMGDNRVDSSDSRYIGFIDRSWISGRIFIKIFPFDQIGFIHSGEYTLE